MRNQSLVRQKVFNLAAFAAVLVLFFSFDLGTNRKYTTTIDHVSNTYRSQLTELDISAMDIIRGDVPAEFIRKEFLNASAPVYVATGSMFLLIVGVLVMLLLKRAHSIAGVSVVCVVAFFVLGTWLLDFSMLFPHNGSYSGGDETYIIQSRSTPIWDVIKFILGLTLLLNALHTPVLRWMSKWSENIGQFLATRVLRKRKPVTARTE